MVVYRASIETRNFDFEGFGVDAEQARAALIAGLVVHGREYRLAPDWFEDMTGDIEEHSFHAGAAYRRGNPDPIATVLA